MHSAVARQERYSTPWLLAMLALNSLDQHDEASLAKRLPLGKANMRIMRFIESELEPFEIGARLLAVLAFPTSKDEAAAQRAYQAWCAHYIQEQQHLLPREAACLAAEFSEQAGFDPKTITKSLRQSTRRIRDRLLAARMSRPFFEKAIEGSVSWQPAPGEVSADLVAAYITGSEKTDADAHNLEQRVWRPSLPVIHLAKAFEDDLIGHNHPPGSPLYDMADLPRHRRIVLKAIELQDYLGRKNIFPPRQVREMVQIEWVG